MTEFWENLAVPHPWLIPVCFVAGFIDAIAGGGGLITVPALTLAIGPGVNVIATNKVAGTAAALFAWAVYLKKGRFRWRESLTFAAWVGLGSWIGSQSAPFFPQWGFHVFLFTSCPLLLWVIWRKDLWIEHERKTLAGTPPTLRYRLLVPTALAVGFYDGVWGPGGGTFMLFGLLLCTNLPLLAAVAAGRFVNAISAGASLTGYAAQGHVLWGTGAVMAIGIAAGACAGALCAERFDARMIRPFLAVVVLLLLIRVAWGLFNA